MNKDNLGKKIVVTAICLVGFFMLAFVCKQIIVGLFTYDDELLFFWNMILTDCVSLFVLFSVLIITIVDVWKPKKQKKDKNDR